jgi:hypothetical protein
MRWSFGVGLLMIVMAWPGVVLGQAQTWGRQTGPLVYRVVDTSQSKVPTNGSPSNSGGFSMTGFFSKLNPFAKKPAPKPNIPKPVKKPAMNPPGGFGT